MVYCHSSCLDSLKLYAALWNSSGEFCTHRNSRLGKTGYHGTLKRAMRQNSESTRTGAANRASRAATTVSVPPPSADPAVDVGVGGPAILGRQLALRPDTLAILVATSLLGGSWVLWEKFFKKNAMKKSGDGEGVFSQVLLETPPPADSREYRMALARTRQVVSVHRAIGFLYTGNTARAMVELRRALHENSVCRAPLLNTQHEAEQLQQLYRLHLHNTAQPADFATLLQLRTMLDLDYEVAEKIEKEVLEEGSAYSI